LSLAVFPAVEKCFALSAAVVVEFLHFSGEKKREKEKKLE
jgi:hypothetical protein